MPPFGFRKREHSSPAPPVTSSSTSKAKTNQFKATRAKPTLFEAVDAPHSHGVSVEDNKQFLDGLHGGADDDDDSSSLSEADSDEFQDVPPAKRRKTSPSGDFEEDDHDEDEEMDWEDAIQPDVKPLQSGAKSDGEQEIADVSISMNEDGSYIEPLVSAATIKKGPTKRERQIRIQTHCLHVQSLMWHNTVRNSWLNDAKVQKILIDGLPDGLRGEIVKWRGAMGLLSSKDLDEKKLKTANVKRSAKRDATGKHKGAGRDWSHDASHAEPGAVNMSAGDPLLRLLKVLTAYWRKRFVVTSPCLRKQGYKPLRGLRDDIKAWEKNRFNAEESGERIESLQAFRVLAKNCEGSRDVGAQLFAALLRGLGLDTRMVANLQPAGFGWSKSEEADVKKRRDQKQRVDMHSGSEDLAIVSPPPPVNKSKSKKVKIQPAETPAHKPLRGNKADPINLDDSDSALSDPPSSLEAASMQDQNEDDDDLSVVDLTPSIPKMRKPTKKYDRDLAFPNYWTEVCSPATNKYYPVDPIVLSTIASNDELLQTFEPRGKKAEKSKQVLCYTIAFSADGTAKDVTIRYLKKHQLPGKTKGVRMPAEKIPVYNHKGKVKKYEEYDWFRTVMSLYDRPENQRTAADDLEEQTDLKPFKAGKEEKEVEKESLQWYKQSAEFVLEQHLRREEALRPGSQVVRSFTAGKGDKAKEHPVYRRADVLLCKTVESWHKEGRAIKIGEQPVKYVPMRAVTLVRKREMEDAQRETGEKLKQGLYSIDQTEWIIPPPIENGVIPKNAFGNMDVYVPTMVPAGAVHMPLKGSAKVCKKLGIDFAEACTGFEFGKQRAVPVLSGVVVAKENQQLLRDAWRAEREEQKRKEDTKRTAVALRWWRKMVLGLRVLERVRLEYEDDGATGDDVNPFVAKAQREGRMDLDAVADDDDGEAEQGGFLRHTDAPSHQTGIEGGNVDALGGGFLVEDGITHDDGGGGGFFPEDDTAENDLVVPSNNFAPITPVSLQSMHQNEGGSTHESGRSEASSSKKKKTNQPSKAQRKAFSIEMRGQQSDTSLSSVPRSDVADPSSGSESEIVVPVANKRMSRGKSHKGAQTRPRRRATKSAVTPLRSKYFDHTSSDSSGRNTESGEEESDVEVVKPRQTTARTRSKR